MTKSALDNDTIVAIASGPGPGGIGVVRLSGPRAESIALTLSQRRSLTPRVAHYSQFFDNKQNPIDDGILLFFPAPASFTGEDVVECQIHGSRITLNQLVAACVDLGAQQARPGEFSERAFLNDKIDLVQAEAIADLINAQTGAAARQARASLTGEFSKVIKVLAEEMVALRVFIEAAIDFPEEEIDFLSDGKVLERITNICQQTKGILTIATQGKLYQEGATIVLAGAPNAGKSSLLNVLAKESVAIVTEHAGTTRDILTARVNLNGIPVLLTDTAGLRETNDIVEIEGVRRAKFAIKDADLILHVIDDTALSPNNNPLFFEGTCCTVFNKIDLSQRPAGATKNQNGISVAISTKTGDGIEALKNVITSLLGVSIDAPSVFSARQRHLNVLTAVNEMLDDARVSFAQTGAGELLAEDLRRVHDQLGQITGRLTTDDLLGEIFSTFCIGK
jgi:tRNA modification GTPase